MTALPFSDRHYFLCFDVDVKARRLLNFWLIEGECPEDSKITKKVNINERIIVLFFKGKIAFPEFIIFDRPDKIVVNKAILIFESQVALFTVTDKT